MKNARAFFLLILALVLIACRMTAQDSLVRIDHLSYSILFNLKYKCPSVVQWNLSRSHLGRYSRLAHKGFVIDHADLPPRVKSQDYNLSGFHRGHLCPAGDRGARLDWWRDTFVMTNVAPMYPALNTGAWKLTEDECREMVATGCDLSILVVPLWKDSIAPDFGSCCIHVPSHFFKKAECTVHDGHVLRWLMTNVNEPQIMSECLINEDSATTILSGVATSINP